VIIILRKQTLIQSRDNKVYYISLPPAITVDKLVQKKVIDRLPVMIIHTKIPIHGKD
jgi:hypothetical protein